MGHMLQVLHLIISLGGGGAFLGGHPLEESINERLSVLGEKVLGALKKPGK